VFGPVHGVGDELDGGGVNNMDRSFETSGKAPIAMSVEEIGRGTLQMVQHSVEEPLSQFPTADLVRV
jgi:hypothetical protein